MLVARSLVLVEDLHALAVPRASGAHLVIRRVVHEPAGVPGCRGDDAIELVERALHVQKWGYMNVAVT